MPVYEAATRPGLRMFLSSLVFGLDLGELKLEGSCYGLGGEEEEGQGGTVPGQGERVGLVLKEDSLFDRLKSVTEQLGGEYIRLDTGVNQALPLDPWRCSSQVWS